MITVNELLKTKPVSNIINIKGLDKTKLFIKIYNYIQNNTTFGKPEDALKSPEAAVELLKRNNNDYFRFNLYCDLSKDEVNTTTFNAIYGNDVFWNLTEELRIEEGKLHTESLDKGDTKAGTEYAALTASNATAASSSSAPALSSNAGRNPFIAAFNLMSSQPAPGSKPVAADTQVSTLHRNQVIVAFLNEVHDPLKPVRHLQTKSDSNDYFAWIVGDDRRAGKGYRATKDPNAICFRAASRKYRLTEMAKLQAKINVNNNIVTFDSTAKEAGFTDALIREFQANLLNDDYPSDKVQYCYAIIDQRFLDKLYPVADAYFKLKLKERQNAGATL